MGRWGPNHAADFILTRWLRDQANGQKILNEDTKKPILQFVVIQRRKGDEWAIPGVTSLVDAGEDPAHAAQREFLEEAMDSENLEQNELEDIMKLVKGMFDQGLLMYQGYVDDSRNTDNAWIETSAINCHAEFQEVDHCHLKAGSDAKNVAWIKITSSLNLFASHIDLIEAVANRHQAHW
ncbi:hypothetical protein DAPPUDRAFT_322829 [Daphnia pulex]|uniref:Nudix hydrolase domain-containing protein n=1 Tax=Daphnia pulex TaxID=6669 RepID=E9GX28_DAPPU|nr:hypothetical protein DAPPUDRAFT_322829 [Daphnia pulex]|eukprot:EFX76010.1 hypothetical protein DAPPUDRAFT_322829 [Daphnia pulex]